MNEVDRRIISVISILKAHGIVESSKDFCNQIGVHENTVNMVKFRGRHFTAEHIQSICDTFSVNAKYIFFQSENPFVKTLNLQQNCNKIEIQIF
ncbi:hypothetical protein ACQ1PF_09625 [Ornithobacterium rhinotracheale]